MDDQQIIELYWARAENAIAETADKYGSYCRSIAVHILRDERDSEECVNVTYWKAWNTMPPQRPSCLNRFLAGLKPEARKLFLGRYWYLRSIRELAGDFGLRESKVKMSLLRSREKLKAHLEQEGINL